MAVYTSINKKILLDLLKDYNIGNLIKFNGILEGVENTNYKVLTSKKTYILTIFEKRVDGSDVPFFIELQNYLSKNKIKCPKPICDKNGNYIKSIKNKTCVIMSFLKGKKIKKTQKNHCEQVAKELAKIHLLTKNIKLKRENNLNYFKWKNLFNKCQKYKKINNDLNEILKEIKIELKFLKKNWPKDLPKGIIHADAFQDNVFFIKNNLSGLIDFYFACNDFYAYEIAIVINAWCFNKKCNFDKEKYHSILAGYQKIRKLSKEELKNMPILLRGSAMRFLLTRLYDKLFISKEAFVTFKDPMEYFNILKFHQNNTLENN